MTKSQTDNGLASVNAPGLTFAPRPCEAADSETWACITSRQSPVPGMPEAVPAPDPSPADFRDPATGTTPEGKM
ncbi:hypothetical protein [Bradyrhizobium sp. JYMT SZCCT0180]|uniref:hypothetical protein n=1 Tax=Bradyrhizobium sp. JYMT SZCCT0180 TaxID=2807666 RepID=UPI001BA90466|nr:hypothetical protein [Bradyrhizobium sp. JYMT SZCCT0180]MBR1209588.1 hypothetical protein [Bradyrhizobium sp. JYMT SZCCT0180]